MISIDVIGIIAFIIFVVFKALAESNRQKQVYRRKNETREIARPNPMSPPPVARPWEEVFPPVLSFPWEDKEEVTEEMQPAKQTKEAPVWNSNTLGEGYATEGASTEGFGTEGVATEGSVLAEVSTEGYGTEGADSTNIEGWSIESAGEKEQSKAAAPIPSFKAGLPMEPAEVIRGFVWAELLQPPISKRRACGGRPCP